MTPRQQAIKNGEPRYTGRPCEYGHSGIRYTCHGTCVECSKQSVRECKVDPEKRAKSYKRFAQNNPGKVNAKVARRYATKLQRTPQWSDLNAIKELYIKASQVSEETGVDMHVDHIIPLKGKLVSGLHVPSNLQIITAEENRAKHNTFTTLSL